MIALSWQSASRKKPAKILPFLLISAIYQTHPNLGLIAGDLGLSRFEDKLSDAWPRCHNKDESAFRTMTAFHRMILQEASWGAELVLIDVGPTLRDWRENWSDLMAKAPSDLSIPSGTMAPVGYVVMQHGIRDSRPVKAYMRWMDRIPTVYRQAMLKKTAASSPALADDPYNLAQLKHYRSLMPLTMEANKPMFFLKPADGAIGAHVEAVRSCYQDFLRLAKQVASLAEIEME